ncbi:nucleotide exchange factor GrpE [Prevotella sp. A2931]|uniref:Protein GrpE n=1 Tax=Prevotella illustrans TaxID=2800387 RepID=A0ABS3M2K9_9BACT|nr:MULTISPECIES: nucleotide exchange factor GrpE [Prevotella]MBO1362376.1 nucleotide exchange factor GrpE [Prevotella illustrans]PTL25105.1 nucleotide exchange factor GrpE [Prevotella sp. oral taxon 820]
MMKDKAMNKENINRQETEELKDSKEKETSNDTEVETQSSERCDKTSDISSDDIVLKLEEENAQLKDQLLRKVAEFDNYRKRTIKEKEELRQNGGEKVVDAILPVLDDFERALKDKSEDPAAIRAGVEMIYNKFIKVLEGLGVRKIETDDVDFNVDFHEAIAMVPSPIDEKKGKVIDCVQNGYMMNDKVIRHAKVAVGQ